MQLTLNRDIMTPSYTEGTLLIDGSQECFTLEKPWLDNQPDTSCIPAGTYPVENQFSPHFGCNMPHVLNVPGRSAIMIHPANYEEQLLGCIALGTTRGPDFVGNSRAAFDAFLNKLLPALAEGAVSLTVVNAAPAA